MIRAKLETNTHHFAVVIDGEIKVYCAYCGKEIHPDTEIDHNDVTEYFHCNCKDALREIEIKDKISFYEDEIKRLKLSLPKIKYCVKKVLKNEIVKL